MDTVRVVDGRQGSTVPVNIKMNSGCGWVRVFGGGQNPSKSRILRLRFKDWSNMSYSKTHTGICMVRRLLAKHWEIDVCGDKDSEPRSGQAGILELSV